MKKPPLRQVRMSKQATLDISDELIQNAYRVLKAVGEKANSGEKQQLIEEEKFIELQIRYDMEGDKKNTPRIVELKHSLFSAEDGDSAILLTGRNDTTTKEYLTEHPIPGLTKVTSMDKVRTTFATHEQRRNLLKSYKRFLCDNAILPMMGSVLGNKAFQMNKQPYPVNLKSTASLEKNITKALSSTMFFVNCGSLISIKVGRISFTEEQIVDNVKLVIPAVLKYIDMNNILSVGFTMTDCVFIPVYEKPASELLQNVEEEKVELKMNEEPEEPEEPEEQEEPKKPEPKPKKVEKVKSAGKQKEMKQKKETKQPKKEKIVKKVKKTK